jgi:hypothetical protein
VQVVQEACRALVVQLYRYGGMGGVLVNSHCGSQRKRLICATILSTRADEVATDGWNSSS